MKGIKLVGVLTVLLLALGSSIALAEQAGGDAQDAGLSSPDAESLADRTANTETFNLPNGQLETRIYPDPVNYRDEEGNWRPIGERLRETEEQTLTNGPNSFDVSLPKQIDAKPVRFEVGDQWIESQLLRKDVEGADLEGAVATYEGEGNAPSFEFVGLSNGLKEEIELTSPGQANKFSYELSASDGLTPSLAEDGSIRFEDSEGKAVVVLPAPVMSDSALEPAISRDVHYELGPEEDGHWKLTVEADRGWLDDPSRIFPAFIDPTISVGPAIDCTFGGEKAKDGWIDCASWGRKEHLLRYTPQIDASKDYWQRALMEFETTSIPVNSEISSATFNIRSNQVAQNTKGVELRQTTKPWNWQANWTHYNATGFWTTEGGDYSENLGEVLTAVRGTQIGWWQFNLPTKLVEKEVNAKEWLDTMLKLIDDKVRECGGSSCTERKVSFDSSAATTGANRPYLSVIYKAPAPVVTAEAATSVTETGATLKGQVNPRGYATTYQFEYGLTTSYGTKVPTTAESVGSGTTNVALSKAISGLKGGTTYNYRITATNVYGTTLGENKTFTTPKLPTATTETPLYVGINDATVRGSVNPNGLSTTYQFEYGPTTAYGQKQPASPTSVGSGTTTVNLFPELKGLTAGTTYHYRVVATNAGGTVFGSDKEFTTINPPETTITSTLPTYTAHEAIPPISFTSSQSGSTFKCQLDKEPVKTCTSPYTQPGNVDPQWHTLYITAINSKSQADPSPATYKFNPAIYPPAASTRKLVSPDEGAKSASHFTLRSEWEKPAESEGISSISYQLKTPSWEAFKPIPSQYLWDSGGSHPSWTLAVEKGATKSAPIFFDVKAYAEAEGWPSVVEGLQLRAAFNGSAASASEPLTTTYSRFAGGTSDAAEEVGPASVDLLTGAFTITRTDVSIPVPGSEATLEFTRTYNSAYGAIEKTNSKTLGQMWQPSAPVEAEYEEEAWQKLVVRHEDKVPPVFKEECWNEAGQEVNCGASNSPCDEAHFCEKWEYEAEIPEQNWVEVLANEGIGIPFERIGSSAPYTYIPPEEAKEFALSQSGGSFFLADVNGTKTEFTQNGSTSEYVPSKVSYAGTTGQARLTYGISEGKKRLISAIGPAPAGVTCNPLEGEEGGKNYAQITKGCRSIYFDYIPFAIEGGATEQRLEKITYYDSAGSGTGQVVAKYEYSKATGNLTEAWDPRVTPKALKEVYAYEGTKGARLASLTPAGEEPWQFAYYPTGSGGPYEAKLKSVSRASLLKSGPSTATTTIAYDVPITGGEAPYDLGITAISKWGQSDYPVDATAVFPPTEVPSEKPSDYDEAAIHYMDPSGHRVNTAAPAPPGVEGDSITTSETDIHGNVVRQLSAQNRLRALQDKEPAKRSQELDSHSLYNSDGTRMLESWGPLHEVRLKDGKTVQARQHTTVEYDKGAPTPKEGETWPNLPTREAVGAAIPGVSGDEDVRVTETAYEWSLRKPTEQITDPGGLNLISKTVYNAAGQVIQERQPSDTGGTGAGTTKTIYWTAGTNPELSSCSNAPAWAGLPCRVGPVADPNPAEKNPKVPHTRFSKYSVLDQPLTVDEEVSGSVKRTTTTTYDSAGRPVKTTLWGQGTSIPPVETLYDEATGRPVSQHFVCEVAECAKFDIQETRTTYDKVGRSIKYLDADGGESEVGYDLMGRPVLVWDGKGLQAITYDEESGLATKLTDSAAGSFEASYDADGKMTEQLLPNGLAQQISYDEAGTAVGLRYEKQTFCFSACTWLDFSREYSIGGQVLSQESSLSAQDYGYDGAGRLTLVKDTEGGQCRTRAYVFDSNSNRTSKTAYAPAEGGGCSTESLATKQTYSYDSADRLIGDGVQYDDLGRITTLPTRYAGPQETWLIGGQTLPELKIKSETFASQGSLVLTFPTSAIRFECQMGSSGEISAEEGIKESFNPYNCALYKEGGGKISCGTIKVSMSPYNGTAAGMLISLDFEEEMGCMGDMNLSVSSFQHEFTDEEASKLAVKTKGKANAGVKPVEISGSSTWMLEGPKAGKKLAFKTTGPVTNQGELTTSYYVNDLTRSQTQGAITNTYGLDASLRQRERITSGGAEAGTQIYHYSGGSDSPAWTAEGEAWSRNIGTLGGSLGALQKSNGEITLQIVDMHGDIVATADLDPEATKLLSTQQFDEFGNVKQLGLLEGGSAGYGWLGAARRRTQLPSGVVQMGVRSYIPALGRFLSPDPVRGGSANTYEYAGQDPVNNFDLTGEKFCGKIQQHEICGKNGREYERKAKRYRRDLRLVNKANQTGNLSIKTTEGGLKALMRKPLLLESMKRKIHHWKVEDLRRLRRAAASGAGNSGSSGESLCESAGKVGTVVGSAGLTATVVPGGQGIGLVLDGVGGALGITVWIAC